MQEPWNGFTLLVEAANLTEGDQTDRELVARVKELVRLESAVRAALSQTVAVAVSQGAHESAGHATAADLLRTECHLSGREANELAVAAVRLREQLHQTLVALRSGAITWAHAMTLVRAVDRLGASAVQDVEQHWIELIASRTGPEALQRVVHTRHVEQVGYPSPAAAEPEVTKDPVVPAGASGGDAGARTDTQRAAWTSAESANDARTRVDSTEQDNPGDTTSYGEPHGLSDSHRPPGPGHNPEVQPTGPTDDRTSASTLTLSSETDDPTARKPRTSTSGCGHPDCVAKASLREVSFAVRWLDGGRSTLLGHCHLCDEHSTALVSCPVDRIRVGHSTMIRTIGPALVTDAA